MAIGTVEILGKIESNDQQGIFKLNFKCKGEDYERSKHGSKTEIKAVTLSNMSIVENGDKCEIYVIFDI